MTEIFFTVPGPGRRISLGIYDVTGRLVTTLIEERKMAGAGSVIWNGTNSNNEPVSSGVYFSRMTSGDWSMARKLMLVR